MTRSILLAGVALLSVSISPPNAEASVAPWCAVSGWGDGDLPWDCKYRSIEECRPVIAANRGFCNPNPAYVATPPELRNSRQASPMGSKTSAKSEKAIAVKKESPRHRNANAPTKVVASPVTVKTSRQHGKSDAESKDTLATKVETPQPAQSDGQPNTESKNSVATKVETPQPAQSYGQSDAELKDTVATKIETPQPAQSDGQPNTELKNSVATKVETPQPAQSDGQPNTESKNSVATKVETPQPAQSDGQPNTESKNSVATKVETPQPAQSDGQPNAELKDTVATKVETPQSAQSYGQSNAESKDSVATKVETPQPAQSDDETVIKKAKITVAAKMEDPASVEFVDIKRATNKNTTYEIICGHVKGKKKSGEAIGESPFLYLVKENEAYIVDRGPDSMAAIVYRAQCTSASSR